MVTNKYKKYKKIRDANFFDDAGPIEKTRSAFTQNSIDTFKGAFNKNNIGNTLGALGTGVIDLVGGAISNSTVNTSKADNAIEAVKAFQPADGSLNAFASSLSGLNFADDSFNYKDFTVSTKQGLGNMGKSILSGAATGATVGGPWGAVAGAAAGFLTSGAGWLAGTFNAKKLAKEKQRESLLANSSAIYRATSTRDELLEDEYNNTRRNYAAQGGMLNMSNINKFNMGGPFQHGGIFSNDIIIIDNGGTHEQNPLEGVQLGVDSQGVPNLVEEGEVIWNDYVFSDRLIVPGKKVSFAKEAKKIQKESEERPNDSISKRGVDDSLYKLMLSQEEVRETEVLEDSNMFNKGGKKKSKSNNSEVDNIIKAIAEHDYYVNTLGFPTVKKGKEVERLNKIEKALGQQTNLPESGFFENLYDSIFNNKKEYKTGAKARNKFDDGGLKVPFMHNGKTISDYEFKKRLKDGTAQVDDKYKETPVGLQFLRYAPVFGSGLSVFSDVLGLTNKPDYSSIDEIKRTSDDIKPIGYDILDAKMSYNPLDVQFYSSKLAEQNLATKRAIQNNAQTSSGAIAGLLAADYNNVGRVGDLLRQGQEYNQGQLERIAAFDLQKQGYNASNRLRADSLNKQNDELKLSSAITRARLRDSLDTTMSTGRSTNLTNFFDNLGLVGKEEAIRKLIKDNPSLLYDDKGTYKNSSAKGGYLTIKNKRRRK